MATLQELRAAYRAVEAGAFRSTSVASRRVVVPAATKPSAQAGRLVLVAGCMGSAGTSTVALALATGLGDARVVECCTVAASGLCGASGAELGVVDGWLQGQRGAVLLQRRADRVSSVADLPLPAATSRSVTVLDSSWDVDVLAADPGWLGNLCRLLPLVVLVTRASVPGLRRLDAATDVVGADRVHAVVVGVGRRWPRPLEQAVSATVRDLRLHNQLSTVPTLPSLAVDGITPEPLPAAAVAAVADLVTVVKGTLK